MSPASPPDNAGGEARYVGRFAPSPTGALHFGSLVAALASYLDARRHGGRWRLRIEDLDPPREAPGAADGIRRTLEAYGLHWDGPVIHQSERHERYHEALARLEEAGWLFPCVCTRRQIRAHGNVYPGTCRHRRRPEPAPHSVRIRVTDAAYCFDDAVLGPQTQRPAADCGDFVLQRKDGLFAYQLAVVLDDADQGVSRILRGCDILECTGRQRHLQRALDLNTPDYAHTPVIVNALGDKLSKQSGAAPLPLSRPGPWLVAALQALGQAPAPALARASPGEILERAVADWRLSAVPHWRVPQPPLPGTPAH